MNVVKYRLEDHAEETTVEGTWQEVVNYVTEAASHGLELGIGSMVVSLHDYEMSLFVDDVKIENAKVTVIFHEPDIFLSIG